MAVTTEPPWTNQNEGVGTRNGTTTHTIGHSTAATAPSSGCALDFVPTTGRALAVLVAGAVTHTSSGSGAGSGWTERQQPVNSAELSLFTKDSAAGNDFLTLTHNASNYPIAWVAFEFPAGSTYTNSSSATGGVNTFPALGSLPGSAQVVICGFCVGFGATGTTGGSTVSSPWVEDFDSIVPYVAASTDGIYLYVFHQINVTATSITPTFTYGLTGGSPQGDRQKVVGAWNVAALSAPPANSGFFGLM